MTDYECDGVTIGVRRVQARDVPKRERATQAPIVPQRPRRLQPHPTARQRRRPSALHDRRAQVKIEPAGLLDRAVLAVIPAAQRAPRRVHQEVRPEKRLGQDGVARPALHDPLGIDVLKVVQVLWGVDRPDGLHDPGGRDHFGRGGPALLDGEVGGLPAGAGVEQGREDELVPLGGLEVVLQLAGEDLVRGRVQQ